MADSCSGNKISSSNSQKENKARGKGGTDPPRAHPVSKEESHFMTLLTALHECQAAQIRETHPEWLTQDWTVFIMKDSQQGAIPSNSRPITSLSTTWKLLSGIIVAKVSRHMYQHMYQYMSRARLKICNISRGTKHQLLADRAAVGDSKTRSTNQCTAWIDYKKAYDSMHMGGCGRRLWRSTQNQWHW